MLVNDAGPGFAQKLDAAMNLDAASKATPADAAATRSELRDQGFSSGEERVWTKGDEYVTVLDLGLSSSFAAATFVTFEEGQLRSSPSVVTYTDPRIPSSVAYTLNGQTRAGAHQTFCEGVWYSLGSAAYEVNDCASAPRYPDFVLNLANKQFTQDGGRLVAPTP